VINREKKKWKGLNKDIEIEEWDGFFRKQLGGVENKIIRGVEREKEKDGRRRGFGEEKNKGIKRRLKDSKTIRVDGMPNEVWRYGGEGIEEWAWWLCNKVWRGKG